MKIKEQLLKMQFQQLRKSYRELLCELNTHLGLCPSSFIDSLRNNITSIERLERRLLIDKTADDMGLAVMTLKQKEYKEILSRAKRSWKKSLVMQTKHGKPALRRSVGIATVAA